MVTLLILIPSAKSSDECFEKTSRAVFNFNMALDNAIIEPIAKGYNKLPDPIKNSTSNFTSNIGTLLSIPIMFYKEILNNLVIQWEVLLLIQLWVFLEFFNPAEKLGLNPNKEDVGQTLGTYGVGTGAILFSRF